jgi:beta propeller repeat protein
MKAKLTTALAAVFVVSVAAVTFGVATARATQVISTFTAIADSHPQARPVLSAGTLVFQQKDGDDWNIYTTTVGASGKPLEVCGAPGDQIRPRVSGVFVVWEDHRAGNADIYAYDTATKKTLVVCDDPNQQVAPRVTTALGDDKAWVVWQDKRAGNWDVYGATIDPATDTVGPAVAICTDSADQTQPDVSGDWVVWTDTRWGAPDIVGYNRVADYTFPICTSDGVQDQPAVSGDTVVWRDARNADTSGTDIYGLDLHTSSAFTVCTAAGDQSAPAVDQDLVVWTDARSPSTGLNVRGFDLTLRQPLPLAMGKGGQSQATISDYQVVWSDAASGAGDLRGATLTPWNAALAIDGGHKWTNTAQIRLWPFAQSKNGIVTQMLLANVKGAVPAWQPYWTVKDPWYLTPGDGLKTVTAVFKDLSGDVSPQVAASITVDTHGPSVSVPAPISAVSGATAIIDYRVNDSLSPRANVTIRVFDRRGNVVLVFVPGNVPTGIGLHWRFTCGLRPDDYKVKIWAKDLAGNQQTKVGINTLTVH